MARIARRGLRLQGLPLLSLPSPWRSVADAAGALAVGGDEPGCLELARRVESPGSPGFGYAEAAERRGGGVGMLVQAQQVRWLDPAVSGCQAVHLTGHGVRSFRILSLRKEEAPGGGPLFTAHVQLLLERDLVRLGPRGGRAPRPARAWAEGAPGAAPRPGGALRAPRAAERPRAA